MPFVGEKVVAWDAFGTGSSKDSSEASVLSLAPVSMVPELVGNDLDAEKFTTSASHQEHNSEARKSLLVINDSVEVVREEPPRMDGDDRVKIDSGEVPRFEGAVVDFCRLETGSNYANSGEPKLLWATNEDEEAFSIQAHSRLQNRKVILGGLPSVGGLGENAGELCVRQSGPSKVPGAEHISPFSQPKAAKTHGRHTKRKAMEDILQLHLSKRGI
ncbi:hypothetical protein Ancab_013971 [Ancistrocladus abbreviatus]